MEQSSEEDVELRSDGTLVIWMLVLMDAQGNPGHSGLLLLPSAHFTTSTSLHDANVIKFGLLGSGGRLMGSCIKPELIRHRGVRC